MSLNFKDITKQLIQVVSSLVGDSLSTSRGQEGEDIPSVILKRTAIGRPSYPYAMVDYIGSNTNGRDIRDTYLNSNLDEVTIIERQAGFTVEIVSGTDDDPLTIIEDLRTQLYRTKGQRAFSTFMQEGVEILDIRNAVVNTTPRQTEFQEVARIVIQLNIVSKYVDDTVGVIEEIELEGYKYDDYDQIDFPHKIETNVP